MSPANRSLFYRRAALAPVCLCLVAALHGARVWTVNQTPWKGGGFGMFSTVDDESARFVRCYLVTPEGQLPLVVPPAAQKLVAELRAAPTQAKLDELARRLAKASWRWKNERRQNEAAAIAAAGGSEITSAVYHAQKSFVRDSGRLRECALSGEHCLEPIPREEDARDAIRFSGVLVQCLRYRYNAATRTLTAQGLLLARADRPRDRQETSP